MTPKEPVQLLDAKDVLPALAEDIHQEPHIKLWCYTVEPNFFERTFLRGRDGMRTSVILDYRQRARLNQFFNTHPGLEIRHWQRNRTQHDKTIICAYTRVVWITTSNLHRGSFMLANNRALRITVDSVFTKCLTQFNDQWKISELVEEAPHQ